jgi:hypothetical protein
MLHDVNLLRYDRANHGSVLNDLSVYGKTFSECLKNPDKVLRRCAKKDLVLNWGKCHFMVREGIVLGHRVS